MVGFKEIAGRGYVSGVFQTEESIYFVLWWSYRLKDEVVFSLASGCSFLFDFLTFTHVISKGIVGPSCFEPYKWRLMLGVAA
jgi:hypothetical protein